MTYSDGEFLRALRTRGGQGPSTAAQVAAQVGCTVRTAQRRLAGLAAQGRIYLEVRGRTYVWSLRDRLNRRIAALTVKAHTNRIADLRREAVAQMDPEERAAYWTAIARGGM